ncbi:hypothetical protein LguiA_030328 [Lonicera macranthoides]
MEARHKANDEAQQKASDDAIEERVRDLVSLMMANFPTGGGRPREYEPKLFLLYASVVGASGLDIGKHWIDLTRLLPHTFEELEEDKRSSGKWTISFKLREPHKSPGDSSLESGGESSRNESNDTESTLIEQGIEYSMSDAMKL